MKNNFQRREREKSERRLRILDAARELFSAGGEEAVTLRRVAEKIEYSATTIYLHFADKEALLRELCAAEFQAFSRVMKQADRVADPLERLRKMSGACIDFGLQYPGHYRLMFLPTGVATSPLPRPRLGETPPTTDVPTAGIVAQPAPEGIYSFLYQAVFRAMAVGCFKPEYQDVAMITQVIWSGLHGVISLHFVRSKFPEVAWRSAGAATEMMVGCLISGLTR